MVLFQMWHVWGTEELHTGLWWGDPREKPLERLGRKWQNNIKMDVQEVG
jgi:hypothetical protein